MLKVKEMNCAEYSVCSTRLTLYNFLDWFVLCPCALWFSVGFCQLEPIMKIRQQEERNFRVLISHVPFLLG